MRPASPTRSGSDSPSTDQFLQGVWFAVGYQLQEWLWSGDLPIQLRIDCVDVMPEMFKQFRVTRPLETASWMWWDMLRTFESIPDGRIVEAMIRAQAAAGEVL